MRVVLDTNSVFSTKHRLLLGPQVDAMVAARDKRKMELFIPEVVKTELLKNYETEMKKRLKEFDSSRQQLGRLISDPGLRVPGDSIDLHRVVAAYESSLMKRLDELGASVIRCPAVDHELILRRYKDCRKPFDDNARGYQDTLIWESILEGCASADQVTFFITNDKDFRDKSGKLHSDLKQDLTNRGLRSSSVILCSDLETFVREHLDLERHAWVTLKSLVDSGQVQGIGDVWVDQHDQIAAIVEDKLSDATIQRALGVPVALWRLEELDINVFEDLESELVLIDDTFAFAKLPSDVLSDFECLVDRRYLEALSGLPAVTVKDLMWTESLCLLKIQFLLRFSLDCFVNRNSLEVQSWDVGRVEVVGLSEFS